MYTRLPVNNPEFFTEFVYMAAKELWPKAVVLDDEAETSCGHVLKQARPGSYGFDIFPSNDEVEQFLGAEAETPHVTVSLVKGAAQLAGTADMVAHLARHPLWSSRV